jgi:hypothetical protein
MAQLVLESDNPHDSNAVRVDVSGYPVGHLSRDDAIQYREVLAQRGLQGTQCTCEARIVGGWSRGRDRGDYGVTLDLDLDAAARPSGSSAPVKDPMLTPERYFARRVRERDMQELIGIIKGVVADGHVSDAEARTLADWLELTPRVARQWPADVIAQRLERVLEDDVISDEERAGLQEILNLAVGEVPEYAGPMKGVTQLPLDVPCPSILFDNHRYCFTGTFVYGTRDACEQAVAERGGHTHPRVTRDVDYLVVGTMVTESWITSTHGRKILKAVDQKKAGHRIKIVCEQDWCAALEA